MPLAFRQRQADDGIGEQKRRRTDLLDEQSFAAVNGQHALRILGRVLDAGVPVVEGQTDEQVQIAFEHFVAADKAADLERLVGVEREGLPSVLWMGSVCVFFSRTCRLLCSTSRPTSGWAGDRVRNITTHRSSCERCDFSELR